MLQEIVLMNRFSFAASTLILCFWTCCGFFCTSETDLYQACGITVNVYTPKKADSIHVAIYNGDNFHQLFKDEITCPKCDASNTSKRASFYKDPDDLSNISGWKYGKYFMAETVFCGNKKTIFPEVSFLIEKGRTSAWIEANYSEHIQSNSTNYDFTSSKNDSTFRTIQKFKPLENGCGIDTTYALEVDYTDLCHKRSDNYLF